MEFQEERLHKRHFLNLSVLEALLKHECVIYQDTFLGALEFEISLHPKPYSEYGP